MSSLIKDEVICRNIITTIVVADSVEGNDINVGAFSGPELSAETLESKENLISVLNTQSLICSTEAIIANNTDVETFNIDTLTVPRINFSSASVTTATTETTTATDLSAEDGESDDLVASGNINSEQMVSTGTVNIEQNLTVRAGEGTEGDFYVSPSEGVFRGICFFKDVDVGIGSPTALISMNMRSVGSVPFINSYNKFLGAIDTGNSLGGSNAVLSLCTASTPARTLRFQQDGNLAIYSNGTKIWQNGSMVSDARLKKNLVPVKSAMEKILKIDGVLFDYTIEGGGEKSCGVILEQVKEVVPECVVDNLVHLEKLVPLLVEGLKELKARNEYIKTLLSQ